MSAHVVVLGGAGEVGEGIVRILLANGCEVSVPSRSPQRLAALAKRVGPTERLALFDGDPGDAASAPGLARSIAARAPINMMVASIGGWWAGPGLAELPLPTWQTIIDGSLTSHLTAAQAFLPHVEPGGQYLFINGGGSRHPVPGSGPICVAAAAQDMLMRVLAAEIQPERVLISALVLMTPIVSRSRPTGDAGWLSSDDVGRAILRLQAEPTEHGASLLMSGRDSLHAA